MPDPTTAELSLVAVPLDGSGHLFDGSTIIPGVHLRWAFTPEMGFPLNGFEVYRRRYSQTEFGYGRSDWRRLAVVGLPHVNRVGAPSSPAAKAAGRERALERLADPVLNPRLAGYRRKAHELIDLLDLLSRSSGYDSVLASASGAATLRVQDVLLLASLDPYVARMLGLYFIDRDVAPGEPVDYYVRGLWSGATWPLKRRPFTNRRCEPSSNPPPGCWQLDDVLATSARLAETTFIPGATPAGDRHVLALRGAPGLPLRLVFPELVEEVQIEISRTDGAPRWRATASRFPDAIHADQVFDIGSSPYARVTATTDRVTIATLYGFGFKRLELFDDAGVSRWELNSLAYRQRVQRLETIDSLPVNVNPPTLNTPFLRRDVMLDRPVIAPTVSSLEAKTAPLGLNEDGVVPTSATQIVLAAGVAGGRALTGSLAPIRLHVRRYRAAGGAGALLTDPGMARMRRQSLIGYWRLDGDAADSRRSITGAVQDGAALGVGSGAAFRPLQLETGVQTERRAFHIFLDENGGRAEGGFIRFAGVAGLDALHNYLRLQCWVAPRPGLRFPTLIGNNYGVSFWFGLERADADDSYRLRLWINGRRFSSQGTLRAHLNAIHWTRVGVEYDGTKLIFAFDGVEDSVYDARLGPVAINRARVLCVGAEHTASDPNDLAAHFPFSGALADVQIWSIAETQARFTAPDLIAVLPLDRSLIELISNRPADLAPFAREVIRERIAPLRDGTPPSLGLAPARDALRHGLGDRLGDRLRGNLRDRLDDRFGRIRPSLGDVGVDSADEEQPSFRPQHPSSPIAHALEFDGRRSLRAALDPSVLGARNSFTAELSVKPQRDLTGATLLATGGVSIELLPTDEAYKLKASVNGRDFISNAAIAADDWSDIAVEYDGDSVQIFIDGALDFGAPAVLGPILLDQDDVFSVGAGRFRGLITDAAIWGRTPSPCSPVILRDKSAMPVDAIAADYLDHHVPNDLYHYETQGVDVFGRVSEWSARRRVRAEDRTPPPAPVNVGGRFKPMTGRVVGRDGDALLTDIPFPIHATTSGGLAGVLIGTADLPRYDAQIFRAVPGGGDAKRQSFEIEAAQALDGALALTLKEALLPNLIPGVGDQVVIMFDAVVHLRWAWTGMQRLNAPTATNFRLYVAQSEPQVLGGRIEWPDAMDPARWGDHYGEIPIAAPASFDSRSATPAATTRLSLDDKQRLFEDAANPILWMPGMADAAADAKHRIYRLTVADIPPPPSVQSPDAANYVAGALVGFDQQPAVQAWRAFPVIWHDWRAGAGFTVYIHDEDSHWRTEPSLSGIRFYPGVAYEAAIPLRDRPSFAVGGAPVAARDYFCTVSAVNASGFESDGNAARLVAVDRRRPPPPPQPRVSLAHADFHGSAPASVSWDPSPERISYLLYRATDSAIFTRDLEQRRRRLGYYAALTPEESLRDDDDFAEWIAAARYRFDWPVLATDWPRVLFAPKPTSVRRDGTPPSDPAEQAAWAAWDRATPVWRAWADHFYPSRGDDAVSQLAARGGNETAFGLVSPTPIEATSFKDAVNGRVRNRYFYRLRTQSLGLRASSAFGPVSLPATIDHPEPLSAPVFTRTVIGDLEVSLDWAMNREPNVASYQLYRSDEVATLDDLRWWRTEPDPRIVASIPDPLLRVSADETSAPILVSPGEVFVEVFGVWRIDAFDPTLPPTAPQPQAMNYFDRIIDGATIALRPIPIGAPVALAFRSLYGEPTIWTRKPGVAPFLDQAIARPGPLFYRLVAVDHRGRRSPPSKINAARAKDSRTPAPPRWLGAEIVRLDPTGLEYPWDDGTPPPPDRTPAMRLEWSSADLDAQYLITRKARDERSWRPVSPTAAPALIGDGDYRAYDPFVDPAKRYAYRIKVISSSGVPSQAYRIIETRSVV